MVLRLPYHQTSRLCPSTGQTAQSRRVLTWCAPVPARFATWDHRIWISDFNQVTQWCCSLTQGIGGGTSYHWLLRPTGQMILQLCGSRLRREIWESSNVGVTNHHWHSIRSLYIGVSCSTLHLGFGWIFFDLWGPMTYWWEWQKYEPSTTGTSMTSTKYWNIAINTGNFIINMNEYDGIIMHSMADTDLLNHDLDHEKQWYINILLLHLPSQWDPSCAADCKAVRSCSVLAA